MNKKKLIGASIIAGALASFMIFVLPRYDLIKETKDTIEIREIEVAKKRKFVDKMIELKKIIEARQDDLSKVESFISSGKHTQDVIINLESIVREAGVAINDFKTGSAKSDTNESFEIMQIELTAGGQYSSISNMIKLIEKNLRIFDIQEISITRKESGGTVSPLISSLKINTYYIK